MHNKLVYIILGSVFGVILAIIGMIVMEPEKNDAIYGIPGEYVPVTNLRPNSLDLVHLDVYSDFTCPHCQKLDREGLSQLKKHYGDRIEVKIHYMATHETTAAPMVLYLVGERVGRAEETAKALMDARLKRANDKINLEPVRAVALKLKLLQRFDEAYASEKERSIAAAQFKAMRHQIAFFPFVVVEGQVGAHGSFENMQKIIDALLSKNS